MTEQSSVVLDIALWLAYYKVSQLSIYGYFMTDQEATRAKEKTISQLLDSVREQYADIDPSMVQASLAILDFSSSALADTESHFARYQLSQGRFGILLLLSLLPEQEWTPAKLASHAGVSRATLSGLLRTLEKDEWILRKPSPNDKRSVQIEISTSGERRMRAMLPDHFERFSQALSTLSLYERLSFLQVLSKVGQAMSTLGSNGQQPDERRQIPLLLD